MPWMESQAVTCPEGLKRPKSRIHFMKLGPASDNENSYAHPIRRVREIHEFLVNFLDPRIAVKCTAS